MLVDGHRRPQIRGDCIHERRPCPWVGCRYHLYFFAEKGHRRRHQNGNTKPFNPWDMKHTCALDLADEQQCTLQEIAEILFITRERVRQIEEMAIRKLRRAVLGNDIINELYLS